MPNNTNEYEVLTQFTDTQGNVHEVGSKVILAEDEAIGGLERGELALLTPITPPKETPSQDQTSTQSENQTPVQPQQPTPAPTKSWVGGHEVGKKM